MKTPFLDIVGILLALATLPLTVELTLLTLGFFLPRRHSTPSAGLSSLRLGVIIPAHNEGILIARCIESLLEASIGRQVRIITVAHNCIDATAAHAAAAGSEVLVYDAPQAKGKGFALRHGFEYIVAQKLDAVLVIDADSVVSPNLIDVVSKALSDGAEVVQCRYELSSVSHRPKTRLTALAFRGFNLVRAAGRDRLGLSSGILGNGFALRQSVLVDQPYEALSLVEDLEYHLQIVRRGKKVKFLREAMVSSCTPASAGGDVTQRSRWEGGRARVARMCTAPLAGQVLRGRFRLIEPLLDLLSLPIGYAALLLMFALCIPLGWLRIYACWAIAALAIHVFAAAWSGPDFVADLRVLCRVPAYIFWKILIVPRLVRGGRTDAAWIRTEREQVSKTA